MTWEKLRARLNAFFARTGVPHRAGVHDDPGKAIVLAKLCLGYKPRYATPERTTAFLNRLERPYSRSLLKPVQLARGLAYRRKLRREHRRTLAERAFAVGESLLGVRETGPNSGPVVTKIILSGGGWTPGLEWCGLFVSYCYRNAGYKRTTWRWMRVWELARFTVRTVDPERGDIVRFKFGHTGLFDCDLGGGRIRTLEGNTSGGGGDGVYRKERLKSQVYDYRRVPA